jgi:hypothetical protein
MYRRVVPGLPVMMALGNALSDAAKKQARAKAPEGPAATPLQRPAGGTVPPATRAA